MAKYNWNQLEKEYIIGDYKSVSAFLKEKNIKNNGTTRKYTSGWKEKKRQKEEKKKTKTIQKIIEKESEKEAQQIVDVKSIANQLAINIIQANSELNRHLAKSKKKTKKVKYNPKSLKPAVEEIEETEEIKDYISIIDRQGLKLLASALKDLNDILEDKNGNVQKDLENAQNILIKIKEVAQNDRND